MYYVEEIVNGELCFKTSPNGKWQPLTNEQLTNRLLEARNQIETLQNQLENQQP